MMATVCIFSCTNDYDPVLIENLGMKKQPLKIITKVLTTKSPILYKNLQEDQSSGYMSSRKTPVTSTIVIQTTKTCGLKPF